MSKTLDTSLIIKAIAELQVIVSEKYFEIKHLPEIREKVNFLYNNMPELTSSYTASENFLHPKKEEKDKK